MTDETDIDILPPELSTLDTEASEAKPRKTFGLAALLGAVFLSSAFGASAIGLTSYFNKAPLPDLGPLQTKIETISSEAQDLAAQNKTLKAQIAQLQKNLKKRSAAIPVNIAPLEKRLLALEEAEPKGIDPELVTRLEALQSEGSEALDLSDIMARLEALENRPITATPPMSAASVSDRIEPISFPNEAVLQTFEAPKGWLKKSLKKHISVQSDNNPHYLVELINKNIEAGDLNAAIAAFDKLPSESKAAAQEWRDSVNP